MFGKLIKSELTVNQIERLFYVGWGIVSQKSRLWLILAHKRPRREPEAS
jgi:hypothetical protein